MSSWKTAFCFAPILTALICLTSPGAADENDSRTFFAQGRNLRMGGNCKDAITAFRRALDLWPQGLGALRNIAECEEEIGQYASARNSYWSLRRAVLQDHDPKYEGWDKYAEERYARLEAKVAKITVKLEGATAETVQVTIDGKPLDPRLIGVELERDLGAHALEARYGGAASLSEKRTLVAGSKEVVTFKIPATPSGSGAGAASGAPPAEPSTFPYRGSAAASFAVGAAGLIGAGISIGVRAEALGAIDKTCSAHTACPESLIPARDRGVTASTLVNVFIAAALAGAGTGITFLAIAPSPASPKKAEIQWIPATGGGVLTVTGRF